jgi:hypothetical protein
MPPLSVRWAPTRTQGMHVILRAAQGSWAMWWLEFGDENEVVERWLTCENVSHYCYCKMALRMPARHATIRVCCRLKIPAHHHDTSAREVRHARMQNKTNNNRNQGSASYLALAEPASQPSQVHIVLYLSSTHYCDYQGTATYTHLTPPQPRTNTTTCTPRTRL